MGKNSCTKKTSIGGQALIEGIMMKGPHRTVISVRTSDGSISTEDMPGANAFRRNAFLKLPVIRGVVGLIESMAIGYKAMMLSAEKSGMLDEDDGKKTEDKTVTKKTEATEESTEAPECTAKGDVSLETDIPSDYNNQNGVTDSATDENCDGNIAASDSADSSDNADKSSGNGILMGIVSVLSAVLGVALALVLFMYLPHAIFTKLNSLANVNITNYQALFEGVIKIIIFVVYMVAVSYMKEMRRVFMYHGAEHKSIFCYEHGLPLTVENIRKQSRFHPRCGTSFLILMLIVSIVVCQLLLLIPPIKAVAASDIIGFKLLWVVIKLLTLPVVCGLGYELIKFCGRHDNIITKIISAPGLWLQHISTKEPDDSMIEVAIEALTAVIPENPEDDRW